MKKKEIRVKTASEDHIKKIARLEMNKSYYSSKINKMIPREVIHQASIKRSTI